MNISYILIICLITQIRAQWNTPAQGQRSCLTPDYEYGICVPLRFCPQVAFIFRGRNEQIARQYLFALQRVCGTRSLNGDPVICCTRPEPEIVNVPPKQDTLTATTPKALTNNPFLSVTTTSPPKTETKTSDQTSAITAENNNSKFCRDPDFKMGECIELKNCPSLVTELFARKNDVSFANFLRMSNAICGGTGSIVCCPTKEQQAEPENGSCGISKNSFNKVVGGGPAKQGAWPWMALIGYDDGISASPFKCGGTLVTSRHVITAAHCIRTDLTFVRLGEHDLETATEAKHIDVKVARKISHPNYTKTNGRADIAVLYLEQRIAFNENISPICLPSSADLRRKSYVKHSPFVAGWGRLEMNGPSASVLQELQISILENEECKRRYAERNRKFTEDQFDAAIICAGVLAGGKDTCQGDSGGPLMIPETFQQSVRYYLIGVISYGIGCAQPGIPGVYTSVQYFMDWILQRISE